MTLRRINDVPEFEDSQVQDWAADLTDDYNALPPTVTFSDYSSPESNVTGEPGTLGVSIASGTTMFWIKEIGSGNTGWASLVTIGYVSDLSKRVAEDKTAYTGLVIHDNSTAQSIGAATPLNWDIESAAQSMPTKNMSVNTQTGVITVSQAGDYQISGSFAFRSATANSTWHVHCFRNGSETSVGGHRKIGTANDIGSMGYGPGILTLAAGDTLDSRISRRDTGTAADVTFEEAQMSVMRIG